MRVRRLVAVAAALVLSTGVLVGCGDEVQPEPTFEPTPSETVSESPSPSASPSAMEEPTPPPEMEGKDEKAAKAFVEYYFAQANFAQATGRTQPVERLAAPVCAACRGFTGAIKQVYASGGVVRGGALTVRDMSVVRRSDLSEGTTLFDAKAVIHVGPQVIRGSGSSKFDGETKAADIPYDLEFSFNSRAGWRMLEWGQAT